MKKLAISIFTALLVVTNGAIAQAEGSGAESPKEVRMRSVLYSADYDSMMAKVQKRQFAEAFPEIIRFARYGEKYAQYLAGLLLVTGEGGIQSNVEEGLVWMRLSLEQETTDWERRYESITKNLTKEQLDALNPLYDEFKSKYGADAQFMRCGYERMRGSNMRHHICRKNLLMNEYYTVVEH